MHATVFFLLHPEDSRQLRLFPRALSGYEVPMR